MTYNKTRRTSGFTMVELLIAIIIIGILVTIIVPVLSNRASDARIAAAKADLEAIANAESQVALDTGYIVRLHVLDDSGAVGDNLGSDELNDVIDSIRDEELNNGGFPMRIFLDTKSGIRLPDTLYTRVKANPEQFGWRGPYVNFHRKLKPDGINPLLWTAGSPLDPWGNPYFLFVAGEESSGGGTAVGGWVKETEASEQPSITFDYVAGYNRPANTFDRPTLLSLGPNGLPGDGSADPVSGLLGAGDDLIRAF